MRVSLRFAVAASALLLACSAAKQDPAHEAVGRSTEAILSPVQTNPTFSGVFRQQVSGIDTKTILGVPETVWYQPVDGTLTTMGQQGYTLMDVDIYVSNGERILSGVFQSGVPYTQYWELTPTDFTAKVAALEAQGIGLVALRTYFAANGTLFYYGVFQEGTPTQIFAADMSWSTFTAAIDSNYKNGYVLNNVAVWVDGNNSEHYLGSWEYSPGNRSYFWVSEWNSFAAAERTASAMGLRLVSMAHWQVNGDRKYAGTWTEGFDTYDLIAATDQSVFDRKVTELAAIGKVPVRVNEEFGYEPPAGLASAFNDFMDTDSIGYSYGITEKGITTAVGGFGYARAPWEQSNRAVPMAASTRLDVGSVTKLPAAAAMFKFFEQSSAANLDTKITSIPSFATGVPLGAGVADVTIRDLLNMDSGICDSTNHASSAQYGTCTSDGSCSGTFQQDYVSWLGCVLQNCTVDLNISNANPAVAVPAPCQAPPFASKYSDNDFGVLRQVLEALTQEPFETYLSQDVFVPTSVNEGFLSPTDIRNVNCNPDLTTPTRPLYYNVAQTSGAGTDEQQRPRDLAVCGTGGMQFTAAQGNQFLTGLTNGTLLTSADLATLLHMSVIQPISANEGNLYDSLVGQGYAKNGGYWITGTVATGPGPTAAVFIAPQISTEVNVFINTQGTDSKNFRLDAQEPIVLGINRMYSFPIDTNSVVVRGSPAMCLNVTGDSRAENASLIEWPCGTSPVAGNMRFVYIDMGNSHFMLQAVDSGLCVTVKFNDSNAGESFIQYPCNGLPNQQFVGEGVGHGYDHLVVQNSGMCLTMPGSTGGQVVQEPCSASNVLQDFHMPSVY